MIGSELILILIVLLTSIITLGIISIIGYFLAPFFLEQRAKADDATYNSLLEDEAEGNQVISIQEKPMLTINPITGIYSIDFGENRALSEGLVKIRYKRNTYSSHPKIGEKALQLSNIEDSMQEDILGEYKATKLTWMIENKVIQTVFKEYTKNSFILFEQQFLEEFNEVSTGNFYDLSCIFPCFENRSPNRKIFTFRNDLFAPPTDKLEKPTTGPVMLYDNDLNTIILSSLNNFLLGVIKEKEGFIEFGIEGKITTIPKFFSNKSILVFGKGINNSFFQWGDILLRYYKTERKSAYTDPILSYLGFWTDNGAYYYYRTEKNLNYHETFNMIDSIAKKKKIPICYYQLDSWWYKKAYRWMPFRIIKLFIGGNMEWAPLEKNFPQGLEEFSKEIKKPLIAHNRWFAKKNFHFGHENFPHRIEKFWAHPTSIEFWEMIMKKCREWNIVTYEQDWLKNQFEHFKYLQENTDTGYKWLSDMATAAARKDVTIQYCMPTPAFFLQAMEFPAVTQIRCSQDYNARFPKSFYIPNFTQTCILSYALGIWPFIDCYLTSRESTRFFYKEKYPELSTLISILSAGIVGPADKAEFLDRELLMKTCRSDGLLLKPDRPATPIDRMFQPHRKYYIISTISQKKDLIWYYVCSINLYPSKIKDQSIKLSELGINENYVGYDYKTRKLNVLESNTSIKTQLSKNDFSYWILAPIHGEKVAFIGDTEKFITCSTKQFPKVNWIGEELVIEIDSLPTETVTLTFYAKNAPTKVTLEEKDIVKVDESLKTKQEGWIFSQSLNSLNVHLTMPSNKAKLRISFKIPYVMS
ncbi:MAG: hypothetical protein EAX86_10015 [Candidatus Heimdallarchaeota archaeon]|nr:hypothetical protein [Candidatus Heimdallarchaeota archaeon]